MVTTIRDKVAFVKGGLQLSTDELSPNEAARIVFNVRDTLTMPLKAEIRSLTDILQGTKSFRRVDPGVVEAHMPGMTTRGKNRFIRLANIIRGPSVWSTYSGSTSTGGNFKRYEQPGGIAANDSFLVLDRRGNILQVDADWQPRGEEDPDCGLVPSYRYWCELTSVIVSHIGEESLSRIFEKHKWLVDDILQALMLVQDETSEWLRRQYRRGREQKREIEEMLKRISLH